MTKKQAINIVLEELITFSDMHMNDDPLYDELREAIKVLEGVKQYVEITEAE